MVAEAGMVIIHGTLFKLLKDEPGTGKSYYQKSAVLFFLATLITMCALAVLIVVDSFAHLKRILRICKRDPDDEKPQKILDSISSSSGSFTEREVSLEDDKLMENIEIYDPKKEQEKIELAKKKEQPKKKPGKPSSPKQTSEPLVSQFGRPLFKDTQQVEKKESSDEDNDETENRTLQTEARFGQSAVTMFEKTPTPLKTAKDPMEETKEALFKPRDQTDEPPAQRFRDPSAPRPQTPTQDNPELTRAEFDNAFKSASNMGGYKFGK